MAEFLLGSYVLADQHLSEVEANAVTVCLSPRPEHPASERTNDHDPDECGSRDVSGIPFDSMSGAPPATTWTRHTTLTRAMTTGSGQSAGSQCLIVAQTECHGSLKFRLLYAQTPHFSTSIRSHFCRVFCPIKKREHQVSTTPCPTWYGVLRFPPK